MKNKEAEEMELEDYNTVEVDTDAKDEKEEDYPNLSIKIEQAQYSIYELTRRYKRGRICVDPDFQRNAVWSERQQSELIESVIMGIPLPLIYLAENADGKLIVVDGRQRLTTFFDFLDNKFKLKNLKILKNINGMNFQLLDEKYPRYVTSIEDTQLVVQIIKYPTRDRVRFDIFDRVNRGGTPLNKQEMRNALYQGNATRLLNELSETQAFQKATGSAISSKHMKDKYIILRAICFELLWSSRLTDLEGNIVVYRSDMEELLGYGMQYLNQLDESNISEIREQFIKIMERAVSCMGTDGFRIPSKGKPRRPISMTLFETLYYYYSLFEQSSATEETIRRGIEQLLEDEAYLDSLQHSVDSSVNVNIRFQKVMNKFKEIADDK